VTQKHDYLSMASLAESALETMHVPTQQEAFILDREKKQLFFVYKDPLCLVLK
jgi:hypothetical protein